MSNQKIKQELLFKRNYKQLKQLFPEMLDSENPMFWQIKREDKNQICNNAFAQRRDDNLLEIGTTCCVDGDFYIDPVFVVLYDNELQLARVTEWAASSRNYTDMPFYERFKCENFNAEETEAERVANSVLFIWLNTFAPKRNENP